MALYQPASSWARACETCKITKSEQGDGYTVYVIEVSVPPFTWVVHHRYSDFFTLHEKLIAAYHVDKSLLPPKKIFGSQSKAFVQQRQADLQLYLQTLIHQFGVLPSPLALFLDFPKYEVRTITEELSEMLFFQGDQILASKHPFIMTPLQLHSLTERLKLAEPTCAGDKKCDLGHLLDFVSQLEKLHIKGKSEPLGTSNIVPNNLSFDLLPFKSLKTLQVEGCELLKRLLRLDPLHQTLNTVCVHNSLRDIETILLCGIIHWSPLDGSTQWPQWHSITHANLSHNLISKIHPSVRVISTVSHLNLSHNCIREVENLESLPRLEVLDLSHNKISYIEPLHTRLGNVKILHINNNSIEFLQGFSRLYSLVELDISYNRVASLDEVAHLGGLPCLEKLNLESNPVTNAVDYRPRVLLLFGSRATELSLDGKTGSQKELDTVAVLQALQAAKEGRSLRQGTDRVIPGRKLESGNTTSNPVLQLPLGVCGYPQSASEFRQQVAALRRLGGSDWLRLLNQMLKDNPTVSASKNKVNGSVERSPSDGKIHDNEMESSGAEKLTEGDGISSKTVGSDLSLPEWLTSLDLKNIDFKEYLRQILSLEYEKFNSTLASLSCLDVDCGNPDKSELLLLWTVVVMRQATACFTIPVCMLLTSENIILFKLEAMSRSVLSPVHKCVPQPQMCHLISILPTSILSASVGPRKSYIELKVGSAGGMQSYIFLMADNAATHIFITSLQDTYKLITKIKPSPFEQDTLIIKDLLPCSLMTESSLQPQMLFCQRVSVSKLQDTKCANTNVIHYVIVTPSHIVLMEEMLFSLHVPELEGVLYPSFQACLVINVSCNICCINMKEDNGYRTLLLSTQQYSEENASELNEAKILERELRTCGHWLLIEFESGSVLYVRFLDRKGRSQFLEAFLSARSQ